MAALLNSKMPEIPVDLADAKARADEVLRYMERHRGLLAPPSVVEFSVRYCGGHWCVWVFVARCSIGSAHEEVSHETLTRICPEEIALAMARRLLTRLVYVGRRDA